MSKMKRPTLPMFRCCASVLVAVFWLWGQPQPRAQGDGPQGTSRGENFSAKPPAALFASDCTGAGCHKGPQGLGKNAGIGGLAGFLREHYTNSRESAAALANYLTKIPSGPEPKEARTPRGGKPTAAAPASGWGEEPKPEAKPTPTSTSREARTPKPTPASRTSRATARPDDDPAASAPAATPRPPAEVPAAVKEKSDPKDMPSESAAKPPEPASKPGARVQRGRHPTAAAASAAEPEAAPPAPAAAPPAPPQPAAPPAPKEFDIFD